MFAARSSRLLAILAVTQVSSWGSLYYAIAILAPAIVSEMGWRAEMVYGAFSWCLLVSGLAATPAGMMIDRHGGRVVMALASLLCGSGFLLLATSHSLLQYYLAWTVLGLAMSGVLYEAAFATLNREIDGDVRRAISTLTLFGGFASTVFWPLTFKLGQQLGWRQTYLAYAGLQLLLCAPLHAAMGHRRATAPQAPAEAGTQDTTTTSRSASLAEALRHAAFWKLAFAFAANSFIFSALSVHLIPLFTQFGHSTELAVAASMLIGPMQVAGRIGEMTFARQVPAARVGLFVFSALPAGLAALLLFGHHQWALGAFCMAYGLSNGIMTIVRGAIPHQLFGRENYGAISGAMSSASLLAKAAGPLAIAALVQGAASPYPLLWTLLVAALASLAFFVTAMRSGGAAVRA